MKEERGMVEEGQKKENTVDLSLAPIIGVSYLT